MAEDTQRTKSLNNAADLAESQLERAVQVARSAVLNQSPHWSPQSCKPSS
jgi:hypothetical protein